MASSFLFSVRMRASRAGQHVGGGERLAPPADWEDAVEALAERAARYQNVDEVHLSSDLIGSDELEQVSALPVRTSTALTPQAARTEVAALAVRCEIAASVLKDAFELLDRGPGPGGSVMRGAMLIDSSTGRRLDPDPARGVRVTRVDYTTECRAELRAALHASGLKSHRTEEALAIATKVAWSGVACELCWSDDADYVAGYFSSPSIGYCRFTRIKNIGIPTGGRAFFVIDPASVPQLIRRLDKTPLLIKSF